MRPAAALLLAACSCAATTGPAPRAVPPPPAPGPAYGPEADLRPSPAESKVAAALRPHLREGSVRSPALSRAARELASRAAAGVPAAVAPPARGAALARAGAFDPDPAVYLESGPPAEAAARLAAAPEPGELTHYGIGVAEGPAGIRSVLLAARRFARLERFPREVEPGATAELRGRLLGLRAPRAFVADPEGRVRELAVRGDPAFAASVAFDRPGRWVVEVLGSGPGGPQVAALMVVAAGGASLEAPPRPAGGPDPEDRAEAETRVLAEVNALRQRRGLAPLEPDDRLREVARAHSERMRSAGILAHVLPGGGSVDERLRRARVPFRRAFENLGLGGSALLAHQAIEESPAHLRILVSPEADRIGVGLARGRPGGGEPAVYLTEILVQRVDDGSDSRLRPEERVREVLWRERQRLGLPPLLSDPSLDDLAGRAARAMLRRDDPEPGRVAEEALALGRRDAGADAFVGASPDAAASSGSLRDARYRRVGVGVAFGDSRRFGAGLLWIAVIYTD